jgi:uncharacterized membrane protein
VSAADHSGIVTDHPALAAHDEARTFGERLADAVVRCIGTWTFLIIQSCVIALWIALRAGLRLPIDNPQLTILNLCLSVQAAMTGPLLLLAGNRQATKDRELAAHDFAANQEALRLILELHQGKAPQK